MKHLFLFLFIYLFAVSLTAFAQKTDFALLQKYPEAGQKVTLVYRPDTALTLNTAPVVCVRFRGPGADGVNYQLKKRKSGWICQFIIPPQTVAFDVTLSNGSPDHNEWKPIFQSMIYHHKKPVEWAYDRMAWNLISYWRGDTIKTAEGVKIIDYTIKEQELYPKKNYTGRIVWAVDFTPLFVVNQKINELIKRGNENSLLMARLLLRGQHRLPEFKTLTNVIRQKFPAGELNYFESMHEYENEPDLAKKENLLDEFVKSSPKDSAETKEYRRLSTAIELLKKLDIKNYEAQLKLAGPKARVPEQLWDVLNTWANMGQNLDLAEKLCREAVAAQKHILDTTTVQFNKPYRLEMYNRLLHAMSKILLKQHKPYEAITYLAMVTHTTRQEDYNYNIQYIKILLAMGQKNEALDLADRNLQGWQWDQQLYPILRPVYRQVRGDDAKFKSDSLTIMDSLNRHW